MHNLQELSGFMGDLTPSATFTIAAMAKALKNQGEGQHCENPESLLFYDW